VEQTAYDVQPPGLRRSLNRVENVEVENGRVKRVSIVFAESIGMVFGVREDRKGRPNPVLIGKFHYSGRIVDWDELSVPSPWFRKAVRQAAAIIRSREARALRPPK